MKIPNMPPEAGLFFLEIDLEKRKETSIRIESNELLQSEVVPHLQQRRDQTNPGPC